MCLLDLYGGSGTIYRASDWIVKIAYINFLWILFSLLGLFILGFFPATVAMFAAIRKWIRTERDFSIFKTFWNSFRTEFLTANIVGYVLVAIGYILYIDFKFFAMFDNWIGIVVSLLLLAVTMLFVIVILYIFPVIVHYKLKKLQYFKHALMIGISFPKNTFLLIGGMIIIYFVISFIPPHLAIFLSSLISYFIMKVTYSAFEKVGTIVNN